jgi:hypothetical protein
MEMRIFGRTGMKVSVLGFGCGAVGGLMVRGDPLDQERAIAVSLVGTFAILAAFGISLNNLSLFGLVLAVGIVVDDAPPTSSIVRWAAATGEMPSPMLRSTFSTTTIVADGFGW